MSDVRKGNDPKLGGESMSQLGSHVIMDLHGCDADRLDDADYIKEVLEKAADAARATIIRTILHRYQPQGVTGVCLVQESHLSIHTWPEFGFVAVDIFMCGQEGDPQKALEYIKSALGGGEGQRLEIARGKIHDSVKAGHGA